MRGYGEKVGKEVPYVGAGGEDQLKVDCRGEETVEETRGEEPVGTVQLREHPCFVVKRWTLPLLQKMMYRWRGVKLTGTWSQLPCLSSGEAGKVDLLSQQQEA